MLYYRKMWKAAVLVSGFMLLTGCEMADEETWTPRESAAISIDEEGKVTEYLTETLDQSYYSFDELTAMLNEETASYNAEYGADCITVAKAEQDDTGVSLEITYASGEDYARFNNVEFYYGSMINAQIAGYLFDGTYQKVENGVVSSTEVSDSEVFKDMADMVVVVQAPLEVHVPGKICFTGTEGQVISSSTVIVPESTGEDGQKTSDDQIVYIIFDEDA